MIKLIAIDLDGTLLNSDQQMTARTEKALNAAIEQGVKVVIATGKTRHSGEKIIQSLKLDTPGIYLQGLSVHYPDNTVHHQMTLKPEVSRQVITFAEDRGFDVVAYSGNRILIRRETPEADELYTRYDEPKPEAVGALQNILDSTPINKLIIIKRHDPRKIAALRWQLSMQLHPKEARLTQALSDMLEILPAGGSKATALKAVLRELDIKPEEALAIGDGENDIEMIQLVGIGCAMGNASEKLKAVAAHVMASNDEDGVAEAVERFILKSKLADDPQPEPTATTDAPAAEVPAVDTAAESTTTPDTPESDKTDVPEPTTPAADEPTKEENA